jgi:hypothetical protein
MFFRVSGELNQFKGVYNVKDSLIRIKPVDTHQTIALRLGA